MGGKTPIGFFYLMINYFIIFVSEVDSICIGYPNLLKTFKINLDLIKKIIIFTLYFSGQ